jgi:hypothetical protein
MIESATIPGYVHAIPLNHTPAYKLFHYLFLCEIAQMHMSSREYLAQSGVVTTGDPMLDRQSALQPMQCQMSIAGMAVMHSEGVSINLVQPEDSLKIYQIIYDHLTDWSRAANENVNIVTAPTDDLIKLDAFAAEVYKLARFYWKDSPYHGRLDHFLKNQSRRGVRRSPQVEPTSINHQPEHTPMADSIREGLRDRTKPWK